MSCVELLKTSSTRGEEDEMALWDQLLTFSNMGINSRGSLSLDMP